MRLRIIIVLTALLSLFLNEAQAQDNNNGKNQTLQYLNIKEAHDLLQKDSSIIVIDVRTAHEFKMGHLKKAHNIDISSRSFTTNINKLDKTKVYLVYCRTQNRSGHAVGYMKQQGFKHLYLMKTGFSGWSRTKYPVEK